MGHHGEECRFGSICLLCQVTLLLQLLRIVVTLCHIRNHIKMPSVNVVLIQIPDFRRKDLIPFMDHLFLNYDFVQFGHHAIFPVAQIGIQLQGGLIIINDSFIVIDCNNAL